MTEPANERKAIRKIIDDFLKKLSLSAKYTVRFTKYEAWSIKVREFSGSLGQQMMLSAHLAIKILEDKIHNVVIHWS